MICVFVSEFQDISVPFVIGAGVALVSILSMYFWPPATLAQEFAMLEQKFMKENPGHNMKLRSHSKKNKIKFLIS